MLILPVFIISGAVEGVNCTALSELDKTTAEERSLSKKDKTAFSVGKMVEKLAKVMTFFAENWKNFVF